MSKSQQTLVLIKPDGVQRLLVGRIITRFEERGLKIVALKITAVSAALAQSGCYSHSATYVERTAQACVFSVAELAQVIHEHDSDGKPVAGLLAVLRRGNA